MFLYILIYFGVTYAKLKLRMLRTVLNFLKAGNLTELIIKNSLLHI